MSTSPYYCSFVSEEFIICECGDNFPNEEELRIHIANNHNKSIKTEKEDYSEETNYEYESENEQTFTHEQDRKEEYILSDYCIEEPVNVKTEIGEEEHVTHRSPVQLKLTKISPNEPTLILNKFANTNSGNVLKKLKMSPVKLKMITPNKSIINNLKENTTVPVVPSPMKKVSPPKKLNNQSSSHYKVIKIKKGEVISKEWLASQIMKAQTGKLTIPTINLTKTQLQNLHVLNKPLINLDSPVTTKSPLKQKSYAKKRNPIDVKINMKQEKRGVDTNNSYIYTILQKNIEYDKTDVNREQCELIEAIHENDEQNNDIFEENYEAVEVTNQTIEEIDEIVEEIDEVVEEIDGMVEETDEIVEQNSAVEVLNEYSQPEVILTEEQKEYIIYDENGTELRREFLTDEEAANYNITYEDVAMETITETIQVDEAYVNETEIATETIQPDRIENSVESYEWQCELCGEKFAKKRQYSTHYRRVHEEGLILEKLLRKNKKTNMKQTIYAVICETCGKRCGSKVLLKYHQTVHTGEKPYPCTECSKAFSTPMLLQIHMRIHTGESPYHCTQCPKTFKNKAALNRHDRVHTGIKPYACPECGKCFTQSNSMKLHVRTVHLKLPAPYKRKPRNKPVQLTVQEEDY